MSQRELAGDPATPATQDIPAGDLAPPRRVDIRARYRRWVEPRPDGLPRVRVLLAFPALVGAVVLVLVGLGLSGTSTGAVHGFFVGGDDPDLVAFDPQPIRSDEWNVQTVFAISQVEGAFPRFNDALPGGVDMTILWEVPYAEWSTVFRPHNLAFFVLPLDNAFAFKWWLPGATLLSVCSMFLVSLWPRRPGAAALVSVAFLFSPFFQWWYLPQTLWPPAWALLVMTAVIWVQASGRGRSTWVWAGAVGYLTVTAALGLYVPFLVPCAYVAAAFGVGWVLRTETGEPVRARLRSVGPILLAGVAAGAVLAVYLVTRLSTVRAFLDTVYPGQRLTPTGSMLADDDWESTFLGLFSLGLDDGSSRGIRGNSPEASTFLFVGAFVAVAGIWLLVRRLRAGRGWDVPLAAALGLAALFVAYLLVPGWDLGAHLLLLDRVQGTRLLMGVGLLSVVLIGLVVQRLDADDLRAPWWLAVSVASASVVFHGLFWARIRSNTLLAESVGPWKVLALLFAASVLMFLRRRPAWAAAAYVVLALVTAGWVNPLYRGVFDLRETAVARVVEQQDLDEPGRWVGVGDSFVGSVLTETSVGAFNSLQSAPDRATWEKLDPGNRYEIVWNRLAGVGWTADPNARRMSNPANDQIRVRFDSCAEFEQSAFQNVLSDQVIDQECVELDQVVDVPGATYRVYRVVPPAEVP